MNLKRRTVALASAVVVAALVGPTGAARGADQPVQDDGVELLPFVHHDPTPEGGDNREGKAGNPGHTEHSTEPEEPAEPENPGDIGAPGETENPGDIGAPGDGGDPSEHDEGGRSGDHEACPVTAGPVAVCVDPTW